MTEVVYRIVEHDGGWTYKLGDVFSETFANRASAETAARIVADEQRVPGEDEQISWEDERGNWHDESQKGSDRPTTLVEGAESPGLSAFARGADAGGRADRWDTDARPEIQGDVYLENLAQSARQWVRGSPVSSLLLTGACGYVLSLLLGGRR